MTVTFQKGCARFSSSLTLPSYPPTESVLPKFIKKHPPFLQREKLNDPH